MAKYYYTARDKKGRKTDGYLFSDNEDILENKLFAMGLLLISLREEKDALSKKGVKLKSGKVLNFTLNLASMLKGGVTLVNSLSILIQDCDDPKLLIILVGISDYIEAGGSFKDALSLYPGTFSRLYIGMVDAGEKTGKLDWIMDELASYLEWQSDLRARIQELTMYPLIIFIVLILVVGVLMVFVIPQFESILKETGNALLLSTAIVLGVSRFFIDGVLKKWYISVPVFISMILGMRFITANKQVKFYIDKLKLKLPLFGNLSYLLSVSRFSHCLSVSVASGVTIVQGLELGKEVIGNSFLTECIRRVKESVISGNQLSKSLAITKAFPLFLVRMVDIGEHSGALADELKRVCIFYDKTITRTIKKTFTLLEPLMIVVMGVVVGGICVSIFMPLISLVTAIGDK